MKRVSSTHYVELFELTAYEVAERDDDLIYEYLKHPEFRLATMNSRTRDAMFHAMVEDNGITGGWFYCTPESGPSGPYFSADEALAAARSDNA